MDVRALARHLSDHVNRECDPRENPILAAWGHSICNHGTRSQDTYPHEDLPWGTVSEPITALTTVDGAITPAGLHWRTDVQGVTG